MTDTNQTLGVGIVGCGTFGLRLIEAVADMPELRILGVMDPSERRRDEAARRTGARRAPDLGSLLSDARIQIVALATPPYLHGPHGVLALTSGRHLFVAEPLATSLDEANLLVATARLQGLQIGVHYPLRFVSAYRVLRLLINGGTLGRVSYFGVENRVTTRGLPAEHWFWSHEQSGGLLVERGIHFFDAASHLLGAEPTSVAGCAHTTPAGEQDGALVNMQYGKDTVGSFYLLYDEGSAEERTVVRVAFDNGVAALHGFFPTHLDLEGMPDAQAAQVAAMLGKPLEVVEEVPLPGMEGEARRLLRITLDGGPRDPALDAARSSLTALVRAIRNPMSTPPVTVQEALHSLRVAIRAQEAVDQRSVVTLTA